MNREHVLHYAGKLALAAVTLVIGLWAMLWSLGAIFKTNNLLWALGARGFTPEDRSLLFPGGAMSSIHLLSIAHTIFIPILVLMLASVPFNRATWWLTRATVFIAVLAMDCGAIAVWFAPYGGPIGIQPPGSAFERIRAGFNLLEHVLFGPLLDQAERGASSWVIVVHAVIVTAILLLAIEGLRWAARLVRPRKAHEPDGGELTSSS
ncbi:MAG: hypothetical protein IT365_25210 [Candidatus Hydrogenedentes bacterium]|nr:hypothetical protein [Candidatus Hydrogenedentota bacterium]